MLIAFHDAGILITRLVSRKTAGVLGNTRPSFPVYDSCCPGPPKSSGVLAVGSRLGQFKHPAIIDGTVFVFLNSEMGGALHLILGFPRAAGSSGKSLKHIDE